MFSQTVYSRGPIGEVRQVTITSDNEALVLANATVAPGFVEIDEATYITELAAIDAANAAEKAALIAAENAEMEAAYLALLAAGIPDAVAHRLSGWQHPEDED